VSSRILPHRFPFQLADCRSGERVVLALSAGAVWGQGETPYPATLVIEMLAQAAIVLLGSTPPASAGVTSTQSALLAGVEDFVLLEPPRPGQRLLASAELQARFGGTVKVAGRLEGDGRELATAALLLVVAA
jgi:3-hydroxymyristoyl/3-hydroxydecanoyl-(acyl carrier protein) dehydratase